MASETKHTELSAPWSSTANSWQYTTIYDASGTPICRLDLEDWGVTEDNQSQLEREQARVAAMLVAVPDMLAALHRAERKLSAYIGVCNGDKELTDAVLPMVRVAIAKATS